MKPRRLVGAMCPVCRTVQDWEGEHIFAARISCRGSEHVGAHDPTLVAVVVPSLAHVPITVY